MFIPHESANVILKSHDDKGQVSRVLDGKNWRWVWQHCQSVSSCLCFCCFQHSQVSAKRATSMRQKAMANGCGQAVEEGSLGDCRAGHRVAGRVSEVIEKTWLLGDSPGWTWATGGPSVTLLSLQCAFTCLLHFQKLLQGYSLQTEMWCWDYLDSVCGWIQLGRPY